MVLIGFYILIICCVYYIWCFYNQHGAAGSQGSNNLHLIASTIAIFGNLDYPSVFKAITKDNLF